MFFWLWRRLFLFSLVASSAAIWPFSETQWLKGKFTCDGFDDDGVIVELWEEDLEIFGDNDDYICSSETSEEGNYSIKGSASELTSIEPYLKITHLCFKARKEDRCARVFRIDVPFDAIVRGDEPGSVFQMKTIELTDQPVEEIDCGIYSPMDTEITTNAPITEVSDGNTEDLSTEDY